MILAIDPSIVQTGYAFLTKDKQLVSYGIIKSPKKLSDAERVAHVSREVYKLCEKFKPEELAVETQYVSFGLGGSVIKTSQVAGAAIGAFSVFSDGGVLHVNPKTVKNSLLSDRKIKGQLKRQEAKELSIAKVNAVFGIQNSNDNISDAILIGLICCDQNTN